MDNSKSESDVEQNRLSGQLWYFFGCAFFLSGFAALTYEVVWQRVLVRIIGATTPAAATVVCAFMGGLALGSYGGTYLVRRKNLFVTLAIVELLIALCALASIFVSSSTTVQSITDYLCVTTGGGSLLPIYEVLVTIVLISVPTALIGATFPIVAALLARNSSVAPRLLMRFYAINSSGAVFGAFVSGFFMLPMLGIGKTLLTAAFLNLMSAGLTYYTGSRKAPTPAKSEENKKLDEEPNPYDDDELAQELRKRKPEPQAPQPRRRGRRNRAPFLTLLVLATGAMSFTMEIVWTKFLILLFGSSTYSLSLVLSIFITGLTLGAWLATVITEKIKDKFAGIPSILAATSIALVLNLYQYQAAPGFYLTLKKTFIGAALTGFWGDVACMTLFAIFLILLPSTLIGIVFPLILGFADNAPTEGNNDELLSHHASLLYCANVVGAMIGSIGCGVVLLPAMAEQFTSGIEHATMLIAVGYMLAALSVLLVLRKRLLPRVLGTKVVNTQLDDNKVRIKLQIRDAILLIVITSVALFLRPQWNSALISSGVAYVSDDDLRKLEVSDLVKSLELAGPFSDKEKLLMYQEGQNSTTSVISNQTANLMYLKNNGKVEAAVPIKQNLPAIDSDYPTQVLLGAIPIIYSPSKDLEGLVIGYGSGTTCGAILPSPWLRKLTAVELEKSVWQARKFFQSDKNAAETDASPKFNRVTADARNFLAMSPAQYDFIVSQPAEPWLNGASDLYTTDFYRLAKSRLKENGIFSQWIPLYSLTPKQLSCLINTFQSVFPETKVWHSKRAGELILTGTTGTTAFHLLREKRIESPELNLQLQRIGLNSEHELSALGVALPVSKVAPVELNTDDNLLVEGKLARAMIAGDAGIDAALRQVLSDKLANEGRDNDSHDADELKIIEKGNAASAGELASDSYYLNAIDGEGFNTQRMMNASKDTPKVEAPTFPPTADQAYRIRYYLRTGQIAKAGPDLRSIDMTKPYSYVQLCDIGAAFFVTGDYEKALSTFQSAAKLRPHAAKAQSGIGLCYWMQRKWSEATAPLTESLSLDPNQFLARYALAQTLYAKGDKVEALNQMRAAAQVNPRSLWPGIFVTASYVNDKNLDMAHSNLRLVMRRNNSSPVGLALGYTIGELSGKSDQKGNFKNRYKDITTRDITIEEAQKLVTTILSEPFIVRPVTPK